jgi:hypothetical protein
MELFAGYKISALVLKLDSPSLLPNFSVKPRERTSQVSSPPQFQEMSRPAVTGPCLHAN